MCFGKQKVEQTTTQVVSPEQRDLLNLGINQIKSAQASTPQLPGTTPFDPAQVAAQEGALAKSSGVLQDLATTGAQTQKFLSGDVLDVNTNPALQKAIEAAQRPITENFLNTVLPGFRTGAVQAGALGSERGDLAQEGLASTYMRQVGDTAAGMANAAYGQGLDALVKGQALLPQTQQAMLAPEAAQEAVGATRRGMAETVANEPVAQSQFDWLRGLQLLGSASGVPGGGTTGTVSQPNNTMQTLLGQIPGSLAMLAAFA